MSVCLYVCVSMYVCMDGWMDGCMDACMHACMYVWSRVPCSRERELGGPYHWGGAGIRSPDSYIYTHLYTLDILTVWVHLKIDTKLDGHLSLSSLFHGHILEWLKAGFTRGSFHISPKTICRFPKNWVPLVLIHL